MTRPFRLFRPANACLARHGWRRAATAALVCLAAGVASSAPAAADPGRRRPAPATLVATQLTSTQLAATQHDPTPPTAAPLGLVSPVGGPGSPTLPRSIAALGDAITTGYDACGLVGDCPSASWAIGGQAQVDSHAERLTAINPSSPVQATIHASAGARAADLPAQALAAVRDHADYVTVTIGTRDACAATLAGMTPVATFRDQVATALGTLATGLPDARILLASVPDLVGIWRVGAGRGGPGSAAACPTVLAGPDSPAAPAPAEAARRGQVEARIRAYNDALRDVCAPVRTCGYDRGAVFAAPVTADDLSTADGFHFSQNGQRALAGILWDAGFYPGLP